MRNVNVAFRNIPPSSRTICLRSAGRWQHDVNRSICGKHFPAKHLCARLLGALGKGKLGAVHGGVHAWTRLSALLELP